MSTVAASQNGAMTADPGSLLDLARRARDEALGREDFLDLVVPGYEGHLIVRYGVVAWDDLQRLVTAGAVRDSVAQRNANIDALISACHTLMVAGPGGADPVPLADALRETGESIPPGVNVRFDALAVKALGLEPAEGTGARGVVMEVYRAARAPELAISEHAGRIGTWMREASSEVDDTVLGES